jgi:sortase A
MYDGPVRDWLYMYSAPQATVARAAQPQAVVATSQPNTPAKDIALGVERAPLPFTTPDMAVAADDGFIAPRAIADAPLAPQALQPERLQIPALELDTNVKEVFVHDGVWEVADYAAGYMHGTALPGEPGTMALAGHAGMRGGVFRSLGNLQPRDDILVDAAGWRYRYRVRESFSVRPTQTEVLAPATTPVLVLITCTNWDTERLIVMADLIESKPIPKN